MNLRFPREAMDVYRATGGCKKKPKKGCDGQEIRGKKWKECRDSPRMAVDFYRALTAGKG